MEKNHMFGPSVLKHSILSDPLLTKFPDFLLGLLSSGEGEVLGGAVGGVQVHLVNIQGDIPIMKSS